MIAVLCLGKAREENREYHQSLDPSGQSCHVDVPELGLRDNGKERRTCGPNPLPFIVNLVLTSNVNENF